MADRTSSIFKLVDGWTILLFLLLVTFGWLNVYGASYTFDQTSAFSFDYRSGKQLVWIGTAIVLGLVILMLDWRMFDLSAYILYGGMFLLLLATPFLAHDIKGSLSWLTLGPIHIQPAEFAKFTTALALAKYMGQYEFKLRSFRDYIIPGLLLVVPMGIIIVLQKETGSALVFASFCFMFYRQGMSGLWLLAVAASIILFIVALKASTLAAIITVVAVAVPLICYYLYQGWRDKRKWEPRKIVWTAVIALVATGYCAGCRYAFDHILQPHQRGRIEVSFGITDDPQGLGYNVNQSKIAIGSGGFWGKGFLKGTQTKMSFVPEQATDFIFCTVGEEWGFIGSVGVLLLYLALILRLIFLAERQKDTFSIVYAYCVIGILIFHLGINVGMVLGLVPVIGIPLPFLSYGGSSLWGFTILLFVLLRLDAARVEKMR